MMGGLTANDDDQSDAANQPPPMFDFQSSSLVLHPFQHQVGGHVGLLVWDPAHVCKPFTERENQFYRALTKLFTEFTAKYCGIVQVSLNRDANGYLWLTAQQGDLPLCTQCRPRSPPSVDHKAKHRFRLYKGSLVVESADNISNLFHDVGSGVSNAQNPWAVHCQIRHVAALQKASNGHCFMVLENLVSRMRRPCIIDLKMGTRQYGDDASVEKKLQQTDKCQRSTSGNMGVRIVGMQVFDRNAGVYHCTNKYTGRALDGDGFRQQLTQFLVDECGQVRRLLCAAFLRRLNALYKLIASAEGYRFFSSSLLLMYDAASATTPMITTDALADEAIDVRMIDFAHSTFAGFLCDQSYTGVDTGYLLGLRSLNATIESIAQLGPNTGSSSISS